MKEKVGEMHLTSNFAHQLLNPFLKDKSNDPQG
jgi:hypothetical protein